MDPVQSVVSAVRACVKFAMVVKEYIDSEVQFSERIEELPDIIERCRDHLSSIKALNNPALNSSATITHYQAFVVECLAKL